MPNGFDLRPVIAEKEKPTFELQPLELETPVKPSAPTKFDLQPLGVSLPSIRFDDTPKDKISKFGKILDIIGRPAQALKVATYENYEEMNSIARDMAEGQTASERIAILTQAVGKELTPGGLRERLGRRTNAAWRGLSGQEKREANEIWKQVGVRGVPLLGFATEIALDPLMYGGYSTITRGVTKLGKVAAKQITRIPGVTPTGAKIAEKTKATTEALRQSFITKSTIPKLNAFIEKYLPEREFMSQKHLQFGVKVRNIIQRTARKTGRTIDDIQSEVVNLIEMPGRKAASTPEINALANTVKSHFSHMLGREIRAGVPISALARGKRGIEYFPRITSREALQYLKAARVSNSKIWNPKLVNAIRRKTSDFTLEEFNALVKAHGLPSLGGRSVEEFFMKQPAYALAVRGARSAKAITSAQFLDDVGKTFGQAQNPGWYEQLPDAVTKLNPSLRGKWFEPEIAKEVTRTTTSYFNPQEIAGFARGFDWIQNTWKRWTLAPFPKYHLRNMIGNIWNNYLAGVTSPKVYAQAQAVQMYGKLKNAPKSFLGLKQKAKTLIEKELRVVGLTTKQADDIILQGEKTGTLGKGWFAADIPMKIQAQLERGFVGLPGKTKFKKLLTGQIVTEKGLEFGSTIENHARLAHFIDKLSKGGAIRAGVKISDDAALQSSMSVKKFLFDYGDLTAFEKQVMKRLLPFYTWTRKNVPLQLEQIWKTPEKFAPIAKLIERNKAQDLLRLKYVRPELYERLPVELRRDANTVTYVPLEGLIPAGDLVKLGESLTDIKNLETPDFLVELLTPYLRAPIELKMGRTFYFKTEIERYPEQTQSLLRMDIPVRYKYAATTVLPQARLINELNKLIRKQTRKEELTIGEEAFAQTLSSIYKINIKDLRIRALQSVEKKKRSLQTGMFWAKRYKRVEEQERIRHTLNELKELQKELK